MACEIFIGKHNKSQKIKVSSLVIWIYLNPPLNGIINVYSACAKISNQLVTCVMLWNISHYEIFKGLIMTTAYLLDASIVAEMARWHWHGNNTSNNHRGKVRVYCSATAPVHHCHCATSNFSSDLQTLKWLQLNANSMQCQIKEHNVMMMTIHYMLYSIILFCICVLIDIFLIFPSKF